MPHPFNFYQGPPYGTGINYPYSAIDFFTGVYFPPSLAAGKTVGFLWEGMGQKFVEQGLTISGTPVDSNKQIAVLGLGLYGAMMPLVRESGVLGLGFTGALTSDGAERITFSIYTRGSGLADNRQSGNLNLRIASGEHRQDNRDVPNFGTTIKSGQHIQATTDICRYGISFYGSFFPKSAPEYASVNMRISSVDYSSTAYRTIVSSGTGMAISFRISNVFYDTAV